MKKLKLDHEIAQLVSSGQKTSTWRVFDDKDLRVDDRVQLIDKVDPIHPETWQPIGTATIDRVSERRLQDILDAELDGREGFASRHQMLAVYRAYHAEAVTWQTPVKIIDFHFEPYIAEATMPTPVTHAMLYADGGSRGNPGPSAAGYALYDHRHHLLATNGAYLGITTNNQAEYMGLELGLKAALARGISDLHVYMDSMLVVNQMRGVFKVKNRELLPAHAAAVVLAGRFTAISFTQIPRALNHAADAAVNRVLDQQPREMVASSPKW